jgi:hypothetical protein
MPGTVTDRRQHLNCELERKKMWKMCNILRSQVRTRVGVKLFFYIQKYVILIPCIPAAMIRSAFGSSSSW